MKVFGKIFLYKKRFFISFFLLVKDKEKRGNDYSFDFYILFQKPQTWEQLKAKYDPNGQFTAKYLDDAHKEGINV